MFKTGYKRIFCLSALFIAIGSSFATPSQADDAAPPAADGLSPITNPSQNAGAGTALPPINMGGENIQSVPPPEPTPQTDVNPTPTPASDPAATNLQKTNTGTTPLPPAVTPPTLSPDEAISKARQEIGRKHFAEAKQAIKQSLIGNPKNTALYAELYEVCSKSNDWSDAAFALEKLAEADPSRERDYYVDYAKALFHLQRYEKAKAPALKAIASGKDKDEAHRLLYQIALRQKDEPTAIAEYREYLKLRPNDGEVHWEFANMLYKDGKGLKEALPEYKAAADNRPANSYGHERAAFLLLFDKQYDASISEYIKAIKTAPASESGRLNQALKYAQAQQKAAGAGNAPASKAK